MLRLRWTFFGDFFPLTISEINPPTTHPRSIEELSLHDCRVWTEPVSLIPFSRTKCSIHFPSLVEKDLKCSLHLLILIPFQELQAERGSPNGAKEAKEATPRAPRANTSRALLATPSSDGGNCLQRVPSSSSIQWWMVVGAVPANVFGTSHQNRPQTQEWGGYWLVD